MITINDKKIEERLNQFKKAIEIVGGNQELEAGFSDNDKLLSCILENMFDKENKGFVVNNKEYNINELYGKKLEYEKYFLKNKSKAIEAIIYKIKKYDTKLDSLVRKYKKTRGIEQYNEICTIINKQYRLDINKIVLKEIDEEILTSLDFEKQEKYYGEYLKQKRKALVDSVISKLGIV